MKSKNILLIVLALSLCLGFSGEKAKNFKLPNLQNKQVELKKLLEEGPVLLDFWATWCKPCIKAFPELEALHKKYEDAGLRVIGINADGPRNQAKVKPFVKSLKITFPILVDLNSDVMRRFRVAVLPTSILIAPDGEIVATNIGYAPKKMKELEKKITLLLDKRQEKNK